jgi:asparagine synthase (glutamine-hydrolysing)
MCGIAGILDLKADRAIDQTVLITMRDTMVHRGPDDAGIYCEQGIGLAHRRLSIIDISSGQQPLTSQSKNNTITFNGEIYNYKELTEELKALGCHFNTQSDTETILNAYEVWGEQCVDHLRGMFAFAIWDNKKQTLFLARDRMGIKPVVYALTEDGYFIFASEHKALLKYPGISREIEKNSIETYFALGYIAEPNTIYKSIKKLSAGHTLSIIGKQVGEPKQYWDIPFKPKIDLDEATANEQMVERLKDAINVRMVAEVPLGAFLSGGVDSSSVVALMSGLQDDPINTCSIGFDTPDYDESDYANQIAALYQTNHHQEIVGSDDFELIDKLIDIYDEPYADSSALPTYRVCEAARKRVTVALSGDGADELMSGYRRHQFHLKEEKIRNMLPDAIRKPLFGALGKLYPKADWAPQFLRAKTTLQALGKDSVDAYFGSVSQNSDETRNKLFSSSFKKDLNGYNAVEVFRSRAKNAPSTDPQSVVQYIDMKTYLIDDILTKVDRASMANSLEVRVPILDHKFVEWVTSIGNQYKYDGKTGKALLKKAMEAYLPHEVLYRKKMGFSVPLADWFRGPLREKVSELESNPRLKETGYFDMNYLKQINHEHQSKSNDHSVLIWSLIMFDAFLKKEANS